MADIRIKDLATTAASTASDDFVAVDGSANGTRKLNAYSPTFGGNLTVSGTGTYGGAINANADGTNIVFKTFGTTPQSALWTNNDGTMTWGDYATGTKSLKLNTTNGNATLGGNLTVSGTGTSNVGGTPSTGLATHSGNLRLLSSVSGPAGVTGIELQNSQSGNGYGYKIYANYSSNDYLGIAGRFNSATWTEFIAIKQDTGNLLIGTTIDGGQKLQVLGAIWAGSTSAGGFGQVSVANNSGAAINNYMLGSTYGGTTFGGITGNNQAVIEASSLASSLYVGTGAATSIVLAPNRTAALTLDSSQNATFAGNVLVNAGFAEITKTGTDLFLSTTASGRGITIRTGAYANALYLDSSQNATFAGNITVNGAGPYTLKSRTIINRSDNTSANFGHVSLTRGTGAGTTAALATTGDASNGVASVSLQLSDADRFVVTSAGTVVLGTQASLATNATDGFTYIPVSAGAPTGTPTAYTGKVAMEYDTTNNKLYIYNGGWKSVTLA